MCRITLFQKTSYFWAKITLFLASRFSTGSIVFINIVTFVVIISYGMSFATLWHEFCRLMARVMLPFCRCFAVFWPVLKILKRNTKVCCIFLGGGGCKSLSMDSLLLSKIVKWVKMELQILMCEIASFTRQIGREY